MRRRYDFEIDDLNNKNLPENGGRRTRNSIHSVPIYVVLFVYLLLLCLLGITIFVDGILPTPLTLSEESTHPEAFITSRAHHDLKLLTQLGPRVAGSYENEILTVDFLTREINFIIQSANKNQQIELDVQVVSGAHYLSDKTGKIVAYSNLQNVVVKLHSYNSTSSLLVNSHFDSVPTSPGGSDDGINCVAMLEILRKLSRTPQRPLNNIIFLFNGAEETGLQAGHGFITKHKWAKECTTVINLEAAGSGGKIILFQTGPNTPWIMKYYNSVPHPYGQAAGEEIFQSGIVPSDTDFRIFRDYGGLIGLDMAFYKNGYRYHTKFDNLDHLPLGSIQHVGDNALSLIRDFANAPELKNAKEIEGKVVYFDFLGLFMVSYTETTAKVINLVAAFASVAISVFATITFKLGYNVETIKYLALTFASIIGGWISAFVILGFVAFLIDKIGYSMSWYGHPWLLLGLYVIPATGVSSIFIPSIPINRLSDNIKAQLHVHSVRLIWTGVLIAGTLLNIRAMYALLIPVAFSTFAFLIIYVFKLQYSVRKWQIILIAALIIPSVFLMYTGLTTLDLFIPISGRIGSDKNTELIIASMAIFFTILITSPFVALVGLVRNFRYMLLSIGVIFVLSFITIFTPLGFPYSGDSTNPTPQRQWILHSRRVFNNETGHEIKRDSGYFLLNLDRNSPFKLKNHVREISRAKSLETDCGDYLLCGLPLAHSKMIQILKYSTWIPAGQPILPETVKLEVLSRDKIAPNLLQYNVSVSGPDRMGLYLSPKKDFKVTAISLIDKMPPEEQTAVWNGRELYFILHVYAKAPAPLQFTFNVQVPENNTDEKTVEIAVTGIFVHDTKNRLVPHFGEFLKKFPDWTDITAWLGSFESWWI